MAISVYRMHTAEDPKVIRFSYHQEEMISRATSEIKANLMEMPWYAIPFTEMLS
jgi:hypothetical protein